MADKLDSELQAIATLLATLQPLDADARTRVLNYVFGKLGIVAPKAEAPAGAGGKPGADVHEIHIPPPPLTPLPITPPQDSGATANDIRALTESKKPKTVTEMVAVMAYYLAHLAKPPERNESIGPDDIKKYFIQANYPLPTAAPRVTLVNAKNAGYLDARGDGRYALNAVGHNLVVHKLPAADTTTATRKRPTKKAAAKAKK